MKLTDAKYISAAIASADARDRGLSQTAPTAVSLDAIVAEFGRPGALSTLSGDGAPMTRVSVTHEDGSRTLGWTAYQADNAARTAARADVVVYLDDMTQMTVPAQSVRPLSAGAKFDKEAIREALKPRAATVRADLQVMGDAIPLGVSDLQLNIAFNAAHGVPGDEEVRRLVNQYVPGARLIDAEVRRRGMLTAMVAVSAADVEVQPPHGGEMPVMRLPTSKAVAKAIEVDDIVQRGNKVILRLSWLKDIFPKGADVKNLIRSYVDSYISHHHRDLGLHGRIKLDVDEAARKAIVLITVLFSEHGIEQETRTVKK